MNWVQMAVTIFCTMLTSSGLWAFVASKQKASDASTRLMLGLAHDAIVSQGVRYINRGYITFDEYEAFMKYLCEPYFTFGGNGMAEKIVDQVKKLDIVSRACDQDTRKKESNE